MSGACNNPPEALFYIFFGLTILYFVSLIFHIIKKKLRGWKILTFIALNVLLVFIIILVNFSAWGAHCSSRDARIKSEIDQLRSTAEIYKMTIGGETSYGKAGVGVQNPIGTVNFTGKGYTDGNKLYNDIISSDVGGESFVLNISENGKAYCMSVKTNVSGTVCADSMGNVKTTACSEATVCPYP
jgi:hypothetical protein